MRNWTLLNPLCCNNLRNNFVIFHFCPLDSSLTLIAFNWLRHKWQNEFKYSLSASWVKRGCSRTEWNWMKQQKAYEIPQQQLSALYIYHTFCLSTIAAFFAAHNFVPSDIYSLLSSQTSDTQTTLSLPLLLLRLFRIHWCMAFSFNWFNWN